MSVQRSRSSLAGPSVVVSNERMFSLSFSIACSVTILLLSMSSSNSENRRIVLNSLRKPQYFWSLTGLRIETSRYYHYQLVRYFSIDSITLERSLRLPMLSNGNPSVSNGVCGSCNRLRHTVRTFIGKQLLGIFCRTDHIGTVTPYICSSASR